jgi:hypothetical protein
MSALNHSLMNECSEGLGFDHLYISPRSLSIKNCTEILYLLNEGNVASVQPKMRLRRSISSGETDSMNF